MGEFNDERDGRVEDMRLAVSNRSSLAVALVEDEASRLASQRIAATYVSKCEDEKDHMPMWMWCLLYFVLGILADISILNVGGAVFKYLHLP